MEKISYIPLERDRHGYAIGDWHPTAAEHNDARVAWNLSQYCDSDRLDEAEESLGSIKERILHALDNDLNFLYQVMALYENIRD